MGVTTRECGARLAASTPLTHITWPLGTKVGTRSSPSRTSHDDFSHTHTRTLTRTPLAHIFIASICRFFVTHSGWYALRQAVCKKARLSCNMNLVKVSVSLNHPGLIDYSGCCACVCVRCRFMARSTHAQPASSCCAIRLSRCARAVCINMRPLGGLRCLRC